MSLIRIFFLILALAAVSDPAHSEGFKVGLVLDKAGKDDQSFNASAFRGAQRAERQLNVIVKTVEVKDAASSESMMRALAGRRFDLIIAVGFSHAGAVKRVAPAFPNRSFVIIDSEIKQPNVTSVMFAEHEGSFLVGAMAALASKTKNVGFIGGMDIPLIRRFALGYESGAKHAVPTIKVQSAYIGITGDAFNNPPKAKELALLQNSEGADVIFHAAGSSGAGLFDAAEEKKFLAIGVDSNQNGVKPGRVLTSLVKAVDVGVFDAIKLAVDKMLRGGETVFHGFSSGGIEMAVDQNNRALLTDDMLKQADLIKAGIINGSIKVPDYYFRAK